MKFIDEYRDAGLVRDIAHKIKSISTKPLNIMEVCGGHTMSIRKNGLHKILGENIKLISGPGCPVCVTSVSDISRIVSMLKMNDVVVCTYGDLVNVPGNFGTLNDMRAEGKDVRVVYSVHDVIEFSEKEKDKKFIFASIGFETTAPTAAAAILESRVRGLDNFFVYSLNKTMPAALKAVLGQKNSIINALLCPGHVTTITGLKIYDRIRDELGIICCVSGFEPVDILRAVLAVTEVFEKNEIKTINAYERTVRENGNEKAQGIMNKVFIESEAIWRGVGPVPGSGLKLRDEFSDMDAEKVFDFENSEDKEHPMCICGEILVGAKVPSNCSLFKNGLCTPASPKGACMVSSEGACAAYFKYGE